MTERKNNHKATIEHSEIQSLPLKAFEGKIVVVQEHTKLVRALDEIKEHDAAGFDTETRPAFVKGQRYNVALMQLALPHKAFLIRVQATGLTPELLDYLQDKDKLKVGLALRDDLAALQRLKRFKPEGFLELTHLTRQAGYEAESIKKLTALLLGFRISKSAQTSNWEAPTLTQKQLQYAATDAWVCLEMYKRLKG
ncbi:MAG: 3'-5' exonuclease domain-containing protein 2 [Flammeovirgaceae bacterium]|nr:MAG: 3'-5' exonuclease domain-containing protein 2 [Flammeovirgaceae bacterium]